MATWARVISNAVVEVVSTDPTTIFHPDVAKLFQVVPDGTKVGATFSAGVWTNPPTPPAPPAPPTIYPKLAVPHFWLCFTPQEESSIRASADAVVKILLRRLDDPRTEFVDLNLPSIQNAITYLSTTSPALIAPARVPQILAGQLQ